jgi:hypothetical protein
MTKVGYVRDSKRSAYTLSKRSLSGTKFTAKYDDIAGSKV